MLIIKYVRYLIGFCYSKQELIKLRKNKSLKIMKYIISFLILFTIFFGNTTFAWADYEYNIKNGYCISIPDEFQSENKKNDEAYFSNSDTESDIDVLFLDIPKDEKGNIEEMKKMVLGDMSKFIPDYKQVDEEKITTEFINGFLTKAVSVGENLKEMRVETSVCISSDGKHYLVINTIYPKLYEEKYSNLSENILKSFRKQTNEDNKIIEENSIKGEI